MATRALFAIFVLTGAFLAPVERKFDTWKSYGGGVDSSQFSSLNQINKNNVTQLTVAWTFQPGGTTNPLIVDGVVFVTRPAAGGGGGRGGAPAAGAPASTPAPAGIVALDGVTGKELWFSEGTTTARGMNYWESADRSDRRLIIINGGFIKEINAQTGQTIATFGDAGRVDPIAESDRTIARPSGNPGRVYKDTIIVSSPASGANYDATPGDVRAFDVRTGKLKWTFHSVPTPGEFGADTWPAAALQAGHGGVHNWSEFTVDEENGMVLVPFGTARFDFYGGNRKGDNLFANSLVALDANTGKRLWHYQMVHHDLWDYDLPTAPKLLTVRNNGQNVDIVAQPTKHGFLFVLNRKTGVPIWPVVEKPVPQSDVPGEYTSPTQPFPTLPEPFARQSFTEKDINPFMTPEQQEQVRQQLRNSRNEGLFTPPSVKGSIEFPGHNGGANWGSSAVDPTRGTMYIVSKELPTLVRLVAPGAGGGGGAGGAGGGRGGGGRGGAAAPEAAAAAGAAAVPPAAGGGQAGGRGAGPAAPAAARGGQGDGRGAGGAVPAPGVPAAPGAAAPAGAGNAAAAGRGGGAGAAGGGRGGGTPRAYRPDGFIEYTSPYVFMQNGQSASGVRGMHVISPPWSQLTAYDLNTGKKLWQVPHGGVTALGDAGKGIGSAAPRGGIVVTAGGLVFSGTPSDRKLHAYDADNGKVVWEYDLPGAPEGVPAVYQAGGREFIIVPTGGATVFQPSGGIPLPASGPAQYVVFALPLR